MVFLRFTGCRPCEMKNLAWPMVDFQRGCAVLKHHKTAKTRKDKAPRVIILHPDEDTRLQRVIDAWP